MFVYGKYTEKTIGKKVDFKCFIIFLMGITILVCVYQQDSIFSRTEIIENISGEELKLTAEATSNGGVFTINTPGCTIPYLHPYDKSILDYVEQPGKYVCNNGTPALFETDMESIKIIEKSLSFYNITNINDLKCCYKAFWREDPHTMADKKISYSNSCETFVNKTDIKEEFIKVTCNYKNRLIYTDVFASVPVKNFTDKVKEDQDKNGSPLNILVLGLDAISRLNFQRQMPKTLNYLRQLGAVEMLGYNKVDDNTFPNVIPALTGKFVKEIQKPKGCWPNKNHHFDDCPFIWKSYKQKGYVTAFDEDSSWMGIFNLLKYGFQKQPTDYSFNYFDREAIKLLGNTNVGTVAICQGARWIYKVHIDYLTQFVRTMEDNSLKYFGFFWENSISHDDLNLPRLADDDYYSMLKSFEEHDYLNNTILFVMSDHGIRTGKIRTTFQGMMEERLPLLFVYLPDWYKQRYHHEYSNLLQNSLRLTTPFDLHETLVHLLDIENSDTEDNSTDKARGISLLKKISEYRSCEDIGIVSHWCTCQKSVEVDIKNQTIKEVADFSVKYINKLLSAYSQCSKLQLNSIASARVMEHSKEILGNLQVSDYMLSFVTIPGNASFEATVRYSSQSKNYAIVGSISRLNLYGKQSACISDYELKLYCYCT
ncbi:uncharacterized protein LOC126888177 isoform X1 [Diabrotica virgifera virgifera]|uniref:DUF229 domain containing protein n=1 Tax=Diabrotica virgifera virgifera TaxID=50390 RepID=A0ABM5KPK8_DIAVI|nr:uncharacterized protein LOC126888177 isoform X1 [Diabrotica virgifera virgifera]